MCLLAQAVLIFDPGHCLGGNKERQGQTLLLSGEAAVSDVVIIGSSVNGRLISSSQKKKKEREFLSALKIQWH